MKKKIFILLLIFFSNIIYADIPKKYLSLKNKLVNVRYGPSFNYPIKYVYKKKYLPIEIIDKKENFRRIIDFKKNSGWIHISQLKKSNSLIILENKILFKKPSKYSKPLVKLEKGRLLIIKKCKNKWCQVTTDNYKGWIDTNNIWGSIN
jgi:SH3-like domain-containing protein